MAKGNNYRTAPLKSPGHERRGDFENGRERNPYRDEKRSDDTSDGDQAHNPGAFAIVERNPFTAVLAAFGVGAGFGLAVTLLVTRREPSWYERNISEPFQHLPERLRHVPDSLASYVPSSWKPH